MKTDPTTPLDPFDPASWKNFEADYNRRKADFHATHAAQSTDNGSKPESKAKSDKFEFCILPTKVIRQVRKAGDRRTSQAPWLILFTLLELWFTQYNRNPVKLTSRSLRGLDISRYQKLRALKLLEKSGQVQIDRRDGKNPLITLRWLPHKKDPRRRSA
jgi:hypothetical protein